MKTTSYGNITVSIQLTSFELCNNLLRSNTKNRKLREPVVERYMRQIQSGNWYLTNQGIGVYEDGSLADGQHRLEAFIRLKAWGIPILIVRGLEESAILAIDQGAKRSVADAIRMTIDISIDPKTVPLVNVLLKDLDNWISKQGSYMPDQVSKVIQDYHESIHAVLNALNNKSAFAVPYLAAWVWMHHNYELFGENEVQEKVVNMIKECESYEFTQDSARALSKFISSNKGSGGGGHIQKDRFLKTLNATASYLSGKQMQKVYARDPR